MKKYLIILAAILGIVATQVFQNCNKVKGAPVAIDGLITGYVYTEVPISGKNSKKKVFLPDVIVTIKDNAGAVVATDTTDIDGGYRTKDLKPGNYTVVLSKTFFTTATYKQTVSEATNHPGQLKITFDGRDFIYGTAMLSDSLPASYRSEVFGVDFNSAVYMNQDTANRVRCNKGGEFILRNVPRDGKFKITAVSQKAVISAVVQADGAAYNLVYKNTRPLIRYITSFNGSGEAILRSLPSEKLKVVANVLDKEGQTLTYMWMPVGNYPGSAFTNAADATWQLTPQKARNTVALLVLDNYGGASYTTYSIDANDGKVAFSGVVVNIDGSGKIADATIKVNGQFYARSDANGYFSIRVDEVKNNRYVLNIEKAGYSLRSLIFQKEAYNQTFQLVKATMREFNPGNDIVITEEEDRFTKFAAKDSQRDGRKRAGASLRIPAGSIIDSAGKKVLSPVTVQLRTIDLYNSEGLMPGDYAAVENGDDKTLVSFGAVDVQIRDKANPDKKYNISKEAFADINIPISSELQRSAPDNISLWDYNEVTGIWVKIADAAKAGDRYIGKTNSFSSINTDVAITGGTCIYLQDNPNNPIFPGSDCDVTVTIPTSGAPKIFHTTISSSDPTLIIARLPLNTDIAIEVKRGGITVAARSIHTSSVSSAAASAINPANPGTVCTNDFYKKDAPLADVAASFAPFLSMVVTPDETQTIGYYKSIGAITDVNGDGIFSLSEGETFAQWKTRNGFGSGDDYRAAYLNAGDLGLHRAMHQKGSGSHVAYYVSNYNNFVDAENDVFGTRSVIPGATVAMEFDRDGTTGPRGIMKFFLFTGPSETLDSKVDLDGNGLKYIPGLCIECHGGREAIDYTSIPSLKNHYLVNPSHVPTFLAFDLQTFKYSAAHDRPTQEADFRNLNQRVYDANATQAIKDFLNAAYSSSGTLSGNFTDNSTAVNWIAGNTNAIANSFFYTSVYGPSCRTCHAARSASNYLQFNTPSDFAAFPVCGPDKYMPNAKVTFINFWHSVNPYQPEQLRLFTGQPICE